MTIVNKPLPPTPVLETARLLLRPLVPADAPAIQRRFPRWEIVRWLNPRVPWPYPEDGAVRFISEHYSENPGIHDGDVFITNDPWIAAIHQMDVVVTAPVFVDGKLFAWVSNATHDKLYLVMDFNPLHEPGQGNQGLRACNGYRYEFHIAKGKSLKDRLVYRVEFTNRLTPEAPPSTRYDGSCERACCSR